MRGIADGAGYGEPDHEHLHGGGRGERDGAAGEGGQLSGGGTGLHYGCSNVFTTVAPTSISIRHLLHSIHCPNFTNAATPTSQKAG